MKLSKHTYQFSYIFDGEIHERPMFLRTRAATLDAATVAARLKFARICKHHGRPYWEGTPRKDSEEIDWVRVPRRVVTGHLYEPGQLVSRAKRRNSKPVSIHRTEGAASALQTMLGAPILRTIESAPSMRELFGDKSLEQYGGFSIPLTYVDYSRKRPVKSFLSPWT